MTEKLFDLGPLQSEDPQAHAIESTRLGALSEHLAIAKLLELGHKVAVPVADDDGVDLIIDYSIKAQVKARSKPLSNTYAFSHNRTKSTIDGLTRSRQKPLTADFWICHGVLHNAWWIVPHEWLIEAGFPIAGTGGFSLSLTNAYQSKYASISRRCRDAWHLLGTHSRQHGRIADEHDESA